MKRLESPLFLATLLSCGVALSCGIAVMASQGRHIELSRFDPRVGLTSGIRDAGQAIRNLELVASLPRPAGFFDPAEPLGAPTQPETSHRQRPEREPRPREFDPAGTNRADVTNTADFTNTDLAFDGRHLFMGSFHGFNVYGIEESRRPKLLASVVCPGGQGDVSVYANLLFMSVEEGRARLDCGTQGHQTAVSGERFRGVRIFDVSDVAQPHQVAAVQTCRGSHTHTLVPHPSDPTSIYIYSSGTAPVRSAQELAGCSDADPNEDANTALFSIDVIKVPLTRPQSARIVSRPRIFADPSTGNIAGLRMGGTHGERTQRMNATSQCHDITVFPQRGLAAGACSGHGILLDISDPEHPIRLDQVVDRNFAFWHSATFNNDGTRIIFTDEWGGGHRPRCRATDPPVWGADAIFEVVDRKLKFYGYYKLPAPQTETENCVAHNGSLIPVPGRDIMVQAWYQGGLSVFDFTDPVHPREIAFFDRGPLDARQLYLGGYWSAYWFNGQIYASEIVRGLDIFKLKPSEFLSQNELTAATLARTDAFNPQQQMTVTWPATAVVGLAYLDQLERSRALPAARIRAVRAALHRADGLTPRSARSSDAAQQLEGLAGQLGASAPAMPDPERARVSALARLLKKRAEALR